MALLEAHLQPKAFDEIKAGKRLYEIALNDEAHRAVLPGDEILLKRRHELTEEMTVIVEEHLYFPNLQRLLDKIPLEDLGVYQNELEFLQSFMAHYRPEVMQRSGIAAFKIKLKS